MKKRIKWFQQRIVPMLLMMIGLAISKPSVGQMMSQGDLLLQSPQTWAFMKYGNTPVSYYTGTAQVEIPIYTYKDNDFEIPISIGYASNGLRPNDRTGVLGMGWHLNVGGVITREVRGVPDEFPGNPNYNALAGYYTYFLHGSPSNPGIGLNGQSWAIAYEDERYNGNYYIETQPDIFHFNIMGMRGSFIFIRNSEGEAEIDIFNTNFPQGEIKIDGPPGEYNQFDIFTMTTSDGFRYIFRIGERYVGRSDDGYDRQYLAPCSWFLEQIIAPNNRKASFLWRNLSIDVASFNPVATWSSNWSIFSGVGYETGSSQINIGLRGKDTDFSYLERIIIDSLFIDFDYDLQTANQYMELASTTTANFLFTHKLNTIHIHDYVGNRAIKSAVFHIEQDTPAKTFFLKQVDLSGEGTYRFDYYGLDSYYPLLGTYQIDHWGYYNANDNLTASSFFPNVTVDDLYDEHIGNNYRDSNPNAAMKGMLHCLHYPTGGRTEFEYEGHDYTYRVMQNSSNSFNPELESETGNAGGVRIKRITDYTSDSSSTYREFFYQLTDSSSSGILLDFPRYSLKFKATSNLQSEPMYPRFPTEFSRVSAESLIPMSLDKTHIEYGRVVERLNDGSSTEYRYHTYWAAPDDLSYGEELQINGEAIIEPDGAWVHNLTRQKNSFHNYRGTQISKQIFDGAQRPILKEEYSYTWPDPENGHLIYDMPLVVGYQYRIYTDPMPLNSIVRTEYFDENTIQTITNYIYNSLGQRIEERTTDSRGNILRTQRQFPHDVSGSSSLPHLASMKEKNVIRYPLKEITTLQSSVTDPEMLTAGSRYLYKTIGNPGFIVPDKTQFVAITAPLPIIGDAFDLMEDSLTDQITYVAHDKYGNPIHSQAKDGTPTTYIWGYEGRYPVAVVQNKTPADIISIPGLSGITTTPLDEALSSDQETALRNLSESLVTTYTHLPYVGIKSITDPAGRVINYEYDAHGRLIKILDEENHPLEHYEYNYKN